MSDEAMSAHGVKPLVEIVAFADAETHPLNFNLAPAMAARKVLQQSGLQISDVDFWEVNEAFSVTPLVFAQALGVDLNKVNIHGGGVSLGHPLGMSGARIVLSLVNVLRTHKGRIGCAAICNGGGGASTIVLRIND